MIIYSISSYLDGIFCVFISPSLSLSLFLCCCFFCVYISSIINCLVLVSEFVSARLWLVDKSTPKQNDCLLFDMIDSILHLVGCLVGWRSDIFCSSVRCALLFSFLNKRAQLLVNHLLAQAKHVLLLSRSKYANAFCIKF